MRSLAFASSTVCHCMLDGSSGLPRFSATIWSTTYPRHQLSYRWPGRDAAFETHVGRQVSFDPSIGIALAGHALRGSSPRVAADRAGPADTTLRSCDVARAVGPVLGRSLKGSNKQDDQKTVKRSTHIAMIGGSLGFL